MKFLLPVLGFLLAVSSAGSNQTPQKARPVHVLFLVGGIFHDYDTEPAAIAENLQKKLAPQASLDFLISKDLDLLRPEKIGAFDLLMLDVCEQTQLSAKQKKGLLDAVRKGLPVVAMHCTFWSFSYWPEFRQMLGAYVPGHAKMDMICLQVTRPGEPITAGAPAQFDLDTEPYIVDDRDPSIRSFVQTCKVYKVALPVTVKTPDGQTVTAKMSPETGPDRDGPEPEVWTKMFGKGHVFSIALGHDSKSLQDPNYLQLLHNGILWDLGLSVGT
jgi:type 1 glutamine amidotransferase